MTQAVSAQGRHVVRRHPTHAERIEGRVLLAVSILSAALWAAVFTPIIVWLW